MGSNCLQCGATLPVGGHECPFCHAPTPLGHAAQARALEDARAIEARAQYERQQALAVGRGQLEQQAQSSLLWSMAAVVLCCVPGPQIMAIVRYVGARGTAQRLGLPLPGKATIGLFVSVTSIVVGVSFLTWAFIRSEDLQKQANARVVELDRQLASKNVAGALDIGTACALAERHVLVEGHQGTKGAYFTGFDLWQVDRRRRRRRARGLHLCAGEQRPEVSRRGVLQAGIEVVREQS